MEQEITAHGDPALGMYACDREMFERIWKRVMPEERPDCPIAVNTAPPAEAVHTPRSNAAPECERHHDPAPMSGVCTAATASALTFVVEEDAPPAADGPAAPEPCECSREQGCGDAVLPEDTAAPEPPSSAVQDAAPVPGEPVQEAPESAAPIGDDFPRPDAVPCLGSGSADHGGQLQEDILAALDGWQLYRHLARKVAGSAARTLSALASEKHRQARKLAAAYFLISGVRYWPTDRLEVPRTAAWLGTLRRRFAAEQQMDSRWRAASLDTEDPCLADLYSELAEGCAAHAGVLRTLLENAL